MMEDMDHNNEEYQEEAQDDVKNLNTKSFKSKSTNLHKNSGLNGLNQTKDYLVYLNKDIEGSNELLSIQCGIPCHYTVQESIEYFLHAFNMKLIKENMPFQLNEDKINWALCQAKKKSGRPKDEPNFAQDILASDTGVSVFSLLPSTICGNDVFVYENGNPDQSEQNNMKAMEQNIGNNGEQQERARSYIDDAYDQGNLISKPQKKPNKMDADSDNGGCFSCFRQSKK